MNSDKLDPLSSGVVTIKKIYHTPSLEEYGDINNLIKSGRVAGVEGDDNLDAGAES